MPITLPTSSRQLILYALPGGGYSTVQAGNTYGTSAFLITADALAHGELATITSDSLNFGTKTGPSKHYQLGDEISLNGVESTAEVGQSSPSASVWSSVTGTVSIVTDNLRHARLNQMYETIGKGALHSTSGMDGLDLDSGRTLYFRYWTYAAQRYDRVRVAGYSSISGTFTLDAKRRRGELVTITQTNSTTYSGWVTYVDTANSLITFEAESGVSPGRTALQGATITGQSSGASVTLDLTLTESVNFASPGSVKICRLIQGGGSNTPRMWAVPSNVNAGQLDVDYWDNTGTEVPSSTVDIDLTATPSKNAGSWTCVEMEVDFSGASGVVRYRQNNGVIDEYSGIPIDYLNASHPWRSDNHGLDTPGTGSIDAATSIGLYQAFGEEYEDNSLYRLVLGDAATLDACSATEIQKITSYSNSAIGIKWNQGAFSSMSGKTLFLVGAGFTTIGSATLP